MILARSIGGVRVVVLSCYGKIERTCISSKLGLFVSNLPDTPDDDWKDALKQELKLTYDVDEIYRAHLGLDYPSGIVELYHRAFPDKSIPETYTDDHFSELAERMICVSLDYEYEDMPLGGWDTNCFDGRCCEDDYAEKIVNFFNFLSNPHESVALFPEPIPQWTYSSNHNEIDHYRLFWGGEKADDYIRSLQEWGKLIDEFLEKREDYLLFDYLVNSIYKDDEHNEYHLMKDYSLCQLLLEKQHESELDIKLQSFLPERILDEEKPECTKLLRQLRNKIAHGDFIAFEDKIEEYAVKFMYGKFWFDYSEYSRKNWAIGSICGLLDEALRRIIHMLFYDKVILKNIKNSL